MNARNQAKIFVLSFLLFALLAVSCSSLLHLNVNYRLPQVSNDLLQGKKVFLSFADQRDSRELIGPGARDVFKNVSQNVSLSLARGNDRGFKLGLYEVPALFMEVFKRRLQHEGMTVVGSNGEADVEIRINLNEFFLNLVDRKWKATMVYEGVLVKGGHDLSRQRITASGERMKVIGQREADRVVGDLFTDAVNQLDILRLFEQAGPAAS